MNKYEILGVSGEGAYGVVLRCRNKETGEIVAIKKFKDMDDPDDHAFRKTTLREVKILRSAQHPNVVGLREAFKRKQRLYLVFEFCDMTLLDLIEANPGGMPIELVKVISFQLLRAIEYLWCYLETVHRDIKPENALLVRRGQDYILKLCDFGFARRLSSGGPTQPGDESTPSTGATSNPILTDYVATRWYRSPELLLNATDYNETVDIWAAALIIAEMLTSEPLFAGDSDVDQLYIIQRVIGSLTRKQMEKFLRNPKFIGVSFPDSRPEGLERRLQGKVRDKAAIDLMQRMLQMDPAKRPSATECLAHEFFDSVREKCLRLEMELMAEMGLVAPQPISAPQAQLPPHGRSASGRSIRAISRDQGDSRRPPQPPQPPQLSTVPSAPHLQPYVPGRYAPAHQASLAHPTHATPTHGAYPAYPAYPVYQGYAGYAGSYAGGYAGSQGTPGNAGNPGTSGSSGPSGTPGYPGYPSYSSYSSYQGYPVRGSVSLAPPGPAGAPGAPGMTVQTCQPTNGSVLPGPGGGPALPGPPAVVVESLPPAESHDGASLPMLPTSRTGSRAGSRAAKVREEAGRTPQGNYGFTGAGWKPPTDKISYALPRIGGQRF